MTDADDLVAAPLTNAEADRLEANVRYRLDTECGTITVEISEIMRILNERKALRACLAELVTLRWISDLRMTFDEKVALSGRDDLAWAEAERLTGVGK